jgi:hypothetical protein
MANDKQAVLASQESFINQFFTVWLRAHSLDL